MVLYFASFCFDKNCAFSFFFFFLISFARIARVVHAYWHLLRFFTGLRVPATHIWHCHTCGCWSKQYTFSEENCVVLCNVVAAVVGDICIRHTRMNCGYVCARSKRRLTFLDRSIFLITYVKRVVFVHKKRSKCRTRKNQATREELVPHIGWHKRCCDNRSEFAQVAPFKCSVRVIGVRTLFSHRSGKLAYG